MEFLNFYKHIERFDDENYLLNLLKFKLAPTTSKLKTATLINLKSSKRALKSIWDINKYKISKDLDLKFLELKESENGYLILFYDEFLLKKNIFEEGRLNFLRECGYDNCLTLKEFLYTLKERCDYSKDCPKEIGIFLDYPLEDVIDFNCCSKECKCAGYWKCYNDEVSSKNLFNLFDRAKLEAAMNILTLEFN